MSYREQAKQIIDQLLEHKMGDLLLFLRGMQFDDEIEDDLYCERLVQSEKERVLRAICELPQIRKGKSYGKIH